MCAKLHTVAASNNRVHLTRSLYYWLFAPRIYGCCSSCIFRSWWTTHSVQRQKRGCNNNPSFLQWIAPIVLSFCESFTQQDLHILVTAPFCYNRKENPRGMCTKHRTMAASNIRVHLMRSLYHCLFAPHIYGCCSSCTLRSWWTAHSVQRQRRGCHSKQQISMGSGCPLALSPLVTVRWRGWIVHETHLMGQNLGVVMGYRFAVMG